MTVKLAWDNHPVNGKRPTSYHNPALTELALRTMQAFTYQRPVLRARRLIIFCVPAVCPKRDKQATTRK